VKIFALITHTVRELIAKATLIVLAGISTLIVLVLAFGLSSRDIEGGQVMTLFGLPVSPPATPEQLAVVAGLLQATLAGGLFAGLVLFGIFATAGIIPDTLERGTVDLFLSKPLARWHLLGGKYLGGVAAILLNIVYFMGTLWLVFGLKLGVWNWGFLLSSLLTTLVYAALFSIVAFFGVLSRGAAISILGGFIYLLVAAPVLESRERIFYPLFDSDVARRVIDGFYWALPQLSAMQEQIRRLITAQPFSSTPFLQASISSLIILACAAWLFEKKDF
jgi:ABC-type transport system involved in multi-copper enzyme maturation permease subunit